MKKPLDIIIAHTVATMPNDLTHLREVAEAMVDLMTVDHPARDRVIRILGAIDCIEDAQRDLVLGFSANVINNTNNKKDGK